MFISLIKSFLLTANLMGPSSLETTQNAKPQIGDNINLEGTYKANNQTADLQLSIENMKFNAQNNTMLVQSTTIIQGQTPIIEKEWTNADEMFNKDNAQFAAKIFCKHAENSEIVELDTPAGKFEACKVSITDEQTDGFVWIGAVPNGVLKLDMLNEQEEVQLLVQDYEWK